MSLAQKFRKVFDVGQDTLTGKILVSDQISPEQRLYNTPNGPMRFVAAQTAVFIAGDCEGLVTGFALNHPDKGVKDMAQLLSILNDMDPSFEYTATPDKNRPIFAGGPDRQGILTIVSDFNPLDLGYSACIQDSAQETYQITSNTEKLKSLCFDDNPGQVKLFNGCFMWLRPQLMALLQKNCWHVVDADPDLVYNTKHPEQIVPSALKRAGIRNPESYALFGHQFDPLMQ